MRTVEDIWAGRVTQWQIPGLCAHEGGYILGQQVFCVQSGFASPKFLERVVRLITGCFDTNPARLSDEMDPGGLAWDYIIAVYRGDDVNDVVAACILVYGRSDERQYFYIFNVCTHPSMARRSLAKVIIDAAYSLCCIALRDRMSDYWKGVLGQSGALWLLLEVSLSHTYTVPPEKLVELYEGLGYRVDKHSISITPEEPWRKLWYWYIPFEPETRRQMWLEVDIDKENQHSRTVSDKVLAELCGPPAVIMASRFEWVLDRFGVDFITL